MRKVQSEDDDSNLPLDVQDVLAVTGHEYYPEWCALNTKYNNSMALAVDAETPDVSDAVVVPVPVVSDAHGLELDFGQKSTVLKRRSNESADERAGLTQDAQTRGLHTNELGFDFDARVPEVDDLRAADLLGVSGERVPPDSIIQDSTEGMTNEAVWKEFMFVTGLEYSFEQFMSEWDNVNGGGALTLADYDSFRYTLVSSPRPIPSVSGVNNALSSSITTSSPKATLDEGVVNDGR